MTNWFTCSSDIKGFVLQLLTDTKKVIQDDFIGFYIHGSLAMGGFNPKKSDIDLLVVTKKIMDVNTKRKLAELFLTYSNNPYPIEVSFLNINQLNNWKHPCPFDFHYSEYWRVRYEDDLSKGTYEYLNEKIKADADLSAHITIINNFGICLEGPPIRHVFPNIPRSHYLSSIMGDFIDCVENIEVDPIYSVLNMIRVYWYLKEGMISSKKEAAYWGLSTFPKEYQQTIQKVLNCYKDEHFTVVFRKNELDKFKRYMIEKHQELLEAHK